MSCSQPWVLWQPCVGRWVLCVSRCSRWVKKETTIPENRTFPSLCVCSACILHSHRMCLLIQRSSVLGASPVAFAALWYVWRRSFSSDGAKNPLCTSAVSQLQRPRQVPLWMEGTSRSPSLSWFCCCLCCSAELTSTSRGELGLPARSPGLSLKSCLLLTALRRLQSRALAFPSKEIERWSSDFFFFPLLVMKSTPAAVEIKRARCCTSVFQLFSDLSNSYPGGHNASWFLKL